MTSILQSLPQKFWTIVTSATERLARSRLAFAGIPVPEHIVTADRVTNGKPHPEPYLKGAKILGLSPADCIVIEDSPSGAKAGHVAGCKVWQRRFLTPSVNSRRPTGSSNRWLKLRLSVLPEDAGLELEFEPVKKGSEKARDSRQGLSERAEESA